VLESRQDVIKHYKVQGRVLLDREFDLSAVADRSNMETLMDKSLANYATRGLIVVDDQDVDVAGAFHLLQRPAAVVWELGFFSREAKTVGG
jgi:uncharacterized membrane-anchored protein